MEIIKETEEMLRRDRVKGLADVIVGGNLLDLEKGAGVVAAAGLFHAQLITQERRALGEEHGERRQSNIRHCIARIVAGAPVGQPGGDAAQTFDEVIEGTQIHASSNAGTRAKVKLQLCDNQ